MILRCMRVSAFNYLPKGSMPAFDTQDKFGGAGWLVAAIDAAAIAVDAAVPWRRR